MSRSALVSPFRLLANLFHQPQRPASDAASQDTPASQKGRTLPPTGHALDRIPLSSSTRGLSEPAEHGSRKRKADHDEGPPAKRTKDEDRQVWMRTKAEIERELMPPPATPRRDTKPQQGQESSSIVMHDWNSWKPDDDSISFVSTPLGRRKAEDLDEEMMEAARRRAAAVTLPANSGVWSQTERELFFHMAYRGFEALLPQNWMIDFGTLPISLFAHEYTTDPPLIQNIRGSHFRACHALRCLFEAGHDVRDRIHVSPGVRPEKILERLVKRYLYWALTDVGVHPRSKSKYAPVHTVVTKRNGQSTLETLEEVATRLHKLSERHQQLVDLHPSIEAHSLVADDGGQTRVIDEDDSSPTLIGLVVISSVLTIVTLNSISVAGPTEPVSQTASPPRSDPSNQAPSDFNPDRLRIIADLDFSQRDQDVWNALGVALVAMQIRREALKANYGVTSYDDLNTMEVDSGSNAESRSEDEFEGDVTSSTL